MPNFVPIYNYVVVYLLNQTKMRNDFFKAFVLFALCACFTIVYAQSPNVNTAAANKFKVQVGAFKLIDPAVDTNKINPLRRVGDVYFEPTEQGLTRLIVGYYDSYEAANQICERVKTLGFAEAMVMRYPKPIPANSVLIGKAFEPETPKTTASVPEVKEVLINDTTSNKETLPANINIDNSIKSLNKKPNPVTKTKDEMPVPLANRTNNNDMPSANSDAFNGNTSNQQNTGNGDIWFFVSLVTYKNIEDLANLSELVEYGAIFREKNNQTNSDFKLLFGPFKTFDAAQNWAKYWQQHGYPEAAITSHAENSLVFLDYNMRITPVENTPPANNTTATAPAIAAVTAATFNNNKEGVGQVTLLSKGVADGGNKQTQTKQETPAASTSSKQQQTSGSTIKPATSSALAPAVTFNAITGQVNSGTYQNPNNSNISTFSLPEVNNSNSAIADLNKPASWNFAEMTTTTISAAAAPQVFNAPVAANSTAALQPQGQAFSVLPNDQAKAANFYAANKIGNNSIDIWELETKFKLLNFESLIVNPKMAGQLTQNNELAKTLVGSPIQPSLLPMFSENWYEQSKQAPLTQHFAVGRYEISPMHEGYLVRSHNAAGRNDLYTLFYLDKNQQKFVGYQNIANYMFNNTKTDYAMLLDINNDKAKDIVLGSFDKSLPTANAYTAKVLVWNGLNFKETSVDNPQNLLQKLGLTSIE